MQPTCVSLRALKLGRSDPFTLLALPCKRASHISRVPASESFRNVAFFLLTKESLCLVYDKWLHMQNFGLPTSPNDVLTHVHLMYLLTVRNYSEQQRMKSAVKTSNIQRAASTVGKMSENAGL